VKTNFKQQYLISIYLVPTVIAIVAVVAIWYASAKYRFSNVDLAFGYLGIITTAFVFIFINKTNWLPLPDGSHIHKSNLAESPTTTTALIEPVIYLHLFYTSTSSKISSVILGLLLTGVGIYIFGDGFIFLPLLAMIGGLFLAYSGYKDFKDKEAKLKLAKEGLWTKELGYKPWSAVSHIELKVERNSRSSQTYLEIYLKKGLSDSPDQKLLITDLTDKGNIQPLIKALFHV